MHYRPERVQVRSLLSLVASSFWCHVALCTFLSVLMIGAEGSILFLSWIAWHTLVLSFSRRTVLRVCLIGCSSVVWYILLTLSIVTVGDILRERLETSLFLQFYTARYATPTHRLLLHAFVVEKLEHDIIQLSDTLKLCVLTYGRFGLRLSGILLWSLYLCPRLSCELLVCLGVSVLSFFYLYKTKLMQDHHRLVQLYARLSVLINDVLRALVMIRTMQQLSNETQMLLKMIRAYSSASLVWRGRYAAIQSGCYSIFFSGLGVLVFLAHPFHTPSPANGLVFAPIVVLWVWIGSYLPQVMTATHTLFATRDAFSRIFLNAETTPELSSIIPAPRPGLLNVRTRGLFLQTSRGSLQDLNWDVPRGTVVGIVSPDDSASLLAQLCAHRRLPEEGQIYIQRRHITTWPQTHLDQLVQYLDDHPILLQRSVQDNLTYGTSQSLSAGALAELLQQLALTDLISRLPQGLDTILDASILEKLTAAEKQALVVGRALLSPIPFLILDRALDALDTPVAEAIIASLLLYPRVRSVIIITQHVKLLATLDRIDVLVRGRVCETGTHIALLEKGGYYYRLFFAQARLSLVSRIPRQG